MTAPGRSGGRCAASQAGEPLHVRDVVGPRAGVPLGPPGHLALHVPRRPSEVGQTRRDRVDRVELDQGVDQRLGEGAHRCGVERHVRREPGAAQDEPLHPLHDVELGAER